MVQPRPTEGSTPDQHSEFWVGAALIGCVFLFIAAAWLVPEFLARTECKSCAEPQRVKVLTDSRSAIIQLFAGLAGAATVYFTWRNYVRSVRDSERSFSLAQEARAADSFVSATAQLGEDSEAARAGGALALGRLLRTAEAEGDYWTIMDVLTAFVRGRATERDPRVDPHRPGTDVEAAINVLARRSGVLLPDRIDGDSPVDLSGTDLSGSWFAKGHWEQAYFAECRLRDADFSCSHLAHASFEGADLTGADFRRADLYPANFRGANVTGARFSPGGDEQAQLTDEQRATILIVRD